MIIGYVRVSTKKQLEGFGIESQKKAIIDKYGDIEIFEEVFTGTTADRPIFLELVEKLNKGDTLVVSKLDRLARNTVEGIQIVENLFEKGVSVHVLNVGLLEDTIMGKFFLTTMLAVAEMERNTIIERTQAGKLIAKQDPNFKDGRPKKFKKKLVERAVLLKEKGKTYKQIESETGISKATVFRAHREWKAQKLLNENV
jgi:DNA invertase Pin-like site-specific DNA recombinase